MSSLEGDASDASGADASTTSDLSIASDALWSSDVSLSSDALTADSRVADVLPVAERGTVGLAMRVETLKEMYILSTHLQPRVEQR